MAFASHFVGGPVEREERVAGGDALILLHMHLAHRAGDIDADRQLVDLHVGIVGVHKATPGDPDRGGGREDHEWYAVEQRGAQPALHGVPFARFRLMTRSPRCSASRSARARPRRAMARTSFAVRPMRASAGFAAGVV